MGNADKTKAQILDAARRILARDGFAGLKVNALAAEAGVGKPLIYRYFGDMQGVTAALVRNLPNGSQQSEALRCNSATEAVTALVGYGRALAGDRTGRDLLAWSLAARDGPALDEGEADEAAGESSSVAGRYADADPAAVMAILQAAAAFLLIYSDRHESWAGMPLSEPRHLARLERALAAITRATLSEQTVTKE